MSNTGMCLKNNTGIQTLDTADKTADKHKKSSGRGHRPYRPNLHRESKKHATILLSISSPNFDQI